MTDVGAVHPDLVGAAGVELEAQQAVIPQALYQAPVGAGMAATLVVYHGIFFAIGRMAPNRPDDRAGVASWLAVHHRQVLARSDALLDLHLQLHQGLLALGHDDAARGVLIEPVHDAWPQLAADARQVGAVVQQAIHQGAVPVTRRRVHRESGGLVEHDQVGVFKQHIQGHLLGQQVGKGLGRRHPQLHHVLWAQGSLGPPGDAVHPHVTRLDELLDPGAALLRPLGHQPAIQPHRQRLGIGERQQLTFALAKFAHGGGSTGSSSAMAPKRAQRKSSSSLVAMRRLSPLVWRSAAVTSQPSTSGPPPGSTPRGMP